MSNSNQHSPTSNSNFRRLCLMILSRASLTVITVLLLGIIAGIWRLWNFVKQDLTPLATQNLTNTLNRPVKLGKVTSFSLTGVKFAASEIPETPTDKDRVNIESVEVGFDVGKLIFNRHLLLDVTLVNPNVYVAQDDQGRWLTTNIARRGPAAFIKTDLDKLRFRDGRLILVPNEKWRNKNGTNLKLTSVGFTDVNGSAKLLENNRLIRLDIMAAGDNGGNITLQGDLIPNKSLVGDFRLRSQNLFAPDITRIVGLPVNLQSGKVNGDLQIKATANRPTLLYGNAVLDNVNIFIPRLPQLLNNSQGNLSFDGLKIQLDNLVTNYGTIPLTASGIIDQQAGFNLQGKINAVSLINAQTTLNVKLPFPISGIAKADIQLLGTIKQPILSGIVNTVKTAQIDKIDFEKISSKFQLEVENNNSSILKITDIQGLAAVGGEIKGQGTIKLGKDPELNFNFTAPNVPGDAIAKIYNINNDQNLKPSWQIGTVSATGSLTGTAKNAQTVVKWEAPQATYPATGTTIVHSDRSVTFENVQAKVGGGLVTGKGSYFNQNWQAITQSSGIKLASFLNQTQQENQEQNINLNGAEFNGGLRISGKTQPFIIEKITPENANVNIAGGKINVQQLQLKDQQFNMELIAKNLYLAKIVKNANPILNNPLTGNFLVSGDRENFDLKTLTATGSAQLTPNQGIIKIGNIQVNNGNYQAQIQAKNINFPTVPGTVTGELQIAGIVESLKLENITGFGSGKVELPNGNITASNIKIAQGNYQAELTIPGLKLTEWNQQLQSKLFGKLQVAGSLTTPKLTTVIAAGRIGLSDDRGINTQADIGWNGQKLIINNAGNGNLQANGYILANAEKSGIPEITDIRLKIKAINYDLQKLPVTLPPGIKIAGNVDFSGEITGIPSTPNILGTLGLNNFKFSQKVANQSVNFVFEPLLTGNIQAVAGQGLNLDIVGKKDRLAVNLDKNHHPQNFLVQWQQALITGQVIGDNLTDNLTDNWGIKLTNFPLDKLNLALPVNTPLSPGGVKGLLTADLSINQKTLATIGNVEIIQPELGRLKGDRLTTQLQYNHNNNTAILTNSEFIKKDSRYNFNATIPQLTNKPQISAQIKIEQGQIQDILRTAQIFEIQDLQRGINAPKYGKASDLTTNSQGLPNEDLFTQIQRLSEINALVNEDEKKRLEAKIIPDLKDLQGQFNGEITINTHTNKTPTLTFDLEGKDFIWGKEKEIGRFYRGEKVIVKGGLEQGIFQLKPLRIETKQKLITFTGNIGGEKQSGQLQVKNFPLERLPLELLNNVVKLPGEITGNLNLTAALAGSINNPQTQGDLEITEGTIDQKQLKSATSSFSYANGRLNFDSNILGIGTGNEPANINGSIPYQFPGSTILNKAEDINLNVNIKNEGLTLLNLFTNEINFENGQGNLTLEVRGTKKQPLVKGKAILDNATFIVQALPGKLTNVTGNAEAKFDLNKVVVENLQGKFSDGKIEAQGELPISINQPVNIENPLTVNLKQLALNFKGLYQGGANGQLQITGSLFQPIIGGNIELFDGKVLLSESTNNSSNNSSLSTNNINNNSNQENQFTKLNNLKLKLGKNVQIARPPVFSFQAVGDLEVNGSPSNPIPNGQIKLTQGGVNLFTTQLNLAKGHENTATFSNRNPRDPYLDIKLFAKILDIVQNVDLTRPNSTGLAALETVRVEANIDGLGSQINENLELRSIPSRSQTEIVTLLGGGFVDTQGRADSTLGLINIAGAAVFNNFQTAFNDIGTAFGLSELRIFPTVVSEKSEANRNNSSLELALEAGVDISAKFSVSIIKILTASDPLQWGLNYRINNEFRLRSSTNLTDDSRAVFEFERRF